MESRKLIKELIKQHFETADRVAGYILTWENRRTRVYKKALLNLESKGTTKFTRKQKIAISEWANEFGQQAPKIVTNLAALGFLYNGKPLTLDTKKFPNLYKFISTHKFSEPLNIKYE